MGKALKSGLTFSPVSGREDEEGRLLGHWLGLLLAVDGGAPGPAAPVDVHVGVAGRVHGAAAAVEGDARARVLLVVLVLAGHRVAVLAVRLTH